MTDPVPVQVLRKAMTLLERLADVNELSASQLAGLIAEETNPGDLVVCLGAGDITSWAYALPGQLEALSK